MSRATSAPFAVSFDSTRPHAATSLVAVSRLVVWMLLAWSGHAAPAADEVATGEQLGARFDREIHRLLTQHCVTCHSTEKREGELDLEQFRSVPDAQRQPAIWQRVAEMIDQGEMPPKDAPEMHEADRRALRGWVGDFLTAEALASAGDPGPVILRRLSNAEYTYTLRDLLQITDLEPAREFPVDGAAGEGFTNTGNALVMSPALLTKYLDAAKQLAQHAVLTPDGLVFSPYTTRRDWTNERLARIRDFYARYSQSGGGTSINLQGIEFVTNEGGLLPVRAYLRALLESRAGLRDQSVSLDQVATSSGLSRKYLSRLWNLLEGPSTDSLDANFLLRTLREAWRAAELDDLDDLVHQITLSQQALWKFNAIGHIGRVAGPRSWQEGVDPLVVAWPVTLELPTNGGDEMVTIYLQVSDGHNGTDGDIVVFERPRLTAPGRPEMLLRDVPRVAAALATKRGEWLGQTSLCLAAASEALASARPGEVPTLATKYSVDPAALQAWFDFLGLDSASASMLGPPLKNKVSQIAGYEFIRGWEGADALSILANGSDQSVRIPGHMPPGSIGVHPNPTTAIGVSWRSETTRPVTITGQLKHAHPECGNGVAWSVQILRGRTRQTLAEGVCHGAQPVTLGPWTDFPLRAGDFVTLVVGPRDGNHSCDLTNVEFTISDREQSWSLARDLHRNLADANPHPDHLDHADVWHFTAEPIGAAMGPSIPAGSLLARWQQATSDVERTQLAAELTTLLQSPALPADLGPADRDLVTQLTSLSGPLLAAAWRLAAAPADPAATDTSMPSIGLAANHFGPGPQGHAVDSADIVVTESKTLAIRLPRWLVGGSQLVTQARILGDETSSGMVQIHTSLDAPPQPGAPLQVPLLVREQSLAQQRARAMFEGFREHFPVAVCYPRIVPIDEVVTLTLHYREDEPLRRLLLTDTESEQLDRMWRELEFVSEEPLSLVNAFEQIAEFATQDRPDLVKEFAPLREKILARAEAFRQTQHGAEPAHLEAAVTFANQVFRGNASAEEASQLRELYRQLRNQEIPHDAAIRLVLARMWVAPKFLYKFETPGPGDRTAPVSPHDLANRLSYFLWSSQPDSTLSEAAARGELVTNDGLAREMHRLRQDPRVRRLAIEFGCQWLHVHGFDQLDEKSERHFPTFTDLRDDMYEESIQFFTDLFANDRSILALLDADYTFLNGPLAEHYGIPDVNGDHWRRVEGTRRFARGGILTQATTLAKQSGASRTSPILRGNWLSEVILGERLPRPPKNVPPLAETAPAGLTERQLIEQHSGNPACAKCHERIDPLGFALEHFDAIGRYRDRDQHDLAIDSRTQLMDGTPLDGLDGLRDYLLHQRRTAFVRQFCRKLLGYALGRSVQLSDEPLLVEMEQRLDAHDYRVSVALESIVLSRQFREIRGRDSNLAHVNQTDEPTP